MCHKEALANWILEMVERYAVDTDGKMDSDKAHIIILGCLQNVQIPQDEDDAVSVMR